MNAVIETMLHNIRELLESNRAAEALVYVNIVLFKHGELHYLSPEYLALDALVNAGAPDTVEAEETVQ